MSSATPSYQPSSKFQDALNAESVAQELGRLGLNNCEGEDRINSLVEQNEQTLREIEAAANEESYEDLFSKFQDIKGWGHWGHNILCVMKYFNFNQF